MATSFNYSITDDFPNSKVDTSRLYNELTESTITIALTSISTTNDTLTFNFKTDISNGEETILDGIVANHTGEKLITEEQRSVDGKLMVQTTPRKRGTKTVIIGVEDDPTNAQLVGGSTKEFKFHHEVGDPLSHQMIIDSNMIAEWNETWLHTSSLICLWARNDDISVHFIPRVVDYGVVGINTPVFSGSGLNDLTASGTYIGSTSKDYRIVIDSPGSTDTFKWSNDGGSTWQATDIDITGSQQILEEGLAITFAATTGHTLNDKWRIKCVKSTTNYRLYQNYLVAPSAFGEGYGPYIDIFNDLTTPNLITGFNNEEYGGLLYSPNRENPATGELEPPVGCFWDAVYDVNTNTYTSITPNYTGTGRYHIFGYPIVLPDTRFINKLPLLGDETIELGSHDIEQLGHGVRMVVTINTKLPDHEWWACFRLILFRRRLT